MFLQKNTLLWTHLQLFKSPLIFPSLSAPWGVSSPTSKGCPGAQKKHQLCWVLQVVWCQWIKLYFDFLDCLESTYLFHPPCHTIKKGNKRKSKNYEMTTLSILKLESVCQAFYLCGSSLLESNLGELRVTVKSVGFSSPNQIKEIKCTQNTHDTYTLYIYLNSEPWSLTSLPSHNPSFFIHIPNGEGQHPSKWSFPTWKLPPDAGLFLDKDFFRRSFTCPVVTMEIKMSESQMVFGIL